METILITAIGSFSAEIAIRKAKGLNWKVVGTDIYPASWVVNSRAVDHFQQVARADSGEKYLKDILSCCEKWSVDYLLPSTDDEIDALAAIRDDLEQRTGTQLILSPAPVLRLLRNKAELATFLEARSLCRTIPGMFLNEITASTGKHLNFPLVLKPVDGRSSQGLQILDGPDALGTAQAGIRSSEARNYLVQPYLSGPVVTVDVFNNENGKHCTALARRELLRTSNGAGLTVEVFRHSELEKACCEIAAATGIRGTACFEFIETDSGFYFLECNPRFSGGVEFSELAGFPCVRNHLELFSSRPITACRLPEQKLTMARRYEAFITKRDS